MKKSLVALSLFIAAHSFGFLVLAQLHNPLITLGPSMTTSGYVQLNQGQNPAPQLTELTLDWYNNDIPISGTAEFKITNGSSKIEIYDTQGNTITSPVTWDMSTSAAMFPQNFFVKGVGLSSSQNDINFEFSHTDGQDTNSKAADLTVVILRYGGAIALDNAALWNGRMWYFNGDQGTQSFFPNKGEIIVKPNNLNESGISFKVTQGSNKITLTPSQNTTNKAEIETTAITDVENEVEISADINGLDVGRLFLTILQPQTTEFVSRTDIEVSFIFEGLMTRKGFETEYALILKDNDDKIMPICDVNEVFSSTWTNHQSNNWGVVFSNAGYTSPGTTNSSGILTDVYRAVTPVLLPQLFPVPLWPSEADADEAVFSIDQKYKAGTDVEDEGTEVQSHKAKYNRGNARQVFP